MKFEIDQKSFLVTLKKASGALSDTAEMPILTTFKVSASFIEKAGVKTPKLQIFSTDESLSTLVNFESNSIKLEEPGSVAVPARKIMQYVENLPETAKIKITSLEGFKISAVAGASNLELNGQNPELYPEIPVWSEVDSVTIDRLVFLNALNRVSYAMAEKSTRVDFMQVNICDTYMGATDSVRISIVDLPAPLGHFKIAKFAVPELVRVLTLYGVNEIHLAKVVGESRFNLFKIGDDILTSRVPEYESMDVKKKFLDRFDAQCQYFATVQKKDVVGMLRRVSVASDEDLIRGSVAITFEQGKMLMDAQDSLGNKCRESIPCTLTLPDKTSVPSPESLPPKRFNYHYLLDLLKVLKNEQVIFRLGPDEQGGMRYPIFVKEVDYLGGIMQRKHVTQLPDKQDLAKQTKKQQVVEETQE